MYINAYSCYKHRLDRVASCDVTVGGIEIPKGMAVVVPVSALHSDPRFWSNPDKYDPERYVVHIYLVR